MDESDPLAERAAKRVLYFFLHAIYQVPWLWERLESIVVFLGHRLPNSHAMAVLGFHVGAVVSQRCPEKMLRVAKLQNGPRLMISLDDFALQGRPYFLGVYEPETTDLVLALLRPGDVFLDVGANAGYYSCLAASRGALIHAFEPNPRLTGLLARSVEMNRFANRCRIVQKAVSDSDGIGRLFLSPNPSWTGASSLVVTRRLGKPEYMTIETITLDSYCSENDITEIRLIKLDVEGAEFAALKGARRVLTQIRPYALICELSDFEDGCDPRDVLAILCSAGYSPYAIRRSARLLEPFAPALQTRSDGSWLHQNVCFLRSDGNGADYSTIQCTT